MSPVQLTTRGDGPSTYYEDRFARPITELPYVPPHEYRVLKTDGTIDFIATSAKILSDLGSYGTNLFTDLKITPENWKDLCAMAPELAQAVQARAMTVGNEIIAENMATSAADGLTNHAYNFNVIEFLEPILVYRSGSQSFAVPRGDLYYDAQDRAYQYQTKPKSAEGIYDLAMKNLAAAADDTGALCFAIDKSAVGPMSLPPVADAGTDQITNEDSLIQLHGENSSGDGLTYIWESLDSDIQIEWMDRYAPTPTLRMPKIFDAQLALNFKLTVINASGESSTDIVSVKVLDVLEPLIPKPLPSRIPDFDSNLFDDLLNDPDLLPRQQA